jgi:hypothetical protein
VALAYPGIASTASSDYARCSWSRIFVDEKSVLRVVPALCVALAIACAAGYNHALDAAGCRLALTSKAHAQVARRRTYDIGPASRATATSMINVLGVVTGQWTGPTDEVARAVAAADEHVDGNCSRAPLMLAAARLLLMSISSTLAHAPAAGDAHTIASAPELGTQRRSYSLRHEGGRSRASAARWHTLRLLPRRIQSHLLEGCAHSDAHARCGTMAAAHEHQRRAGSRSGCHRCAYDRICARGARVAMLVLTAAR